PRGAGEGASRRRRDGSSLATLRAPGGRGTARAGLPISASGGAATARARHGALLGGRSCSGKLEHEGRAPGGWGEPQGATVLLGEFARDRQTEAAPAGRRDTGAKELLAHARRQAGAVVGDAQHDARRRALDRDVDGPELATSARNRGRIVQQVEQDAKQ